MVSSATAGQRPRRHLHPVRLLRSPAEERQHAHFCHQRHPRARPRGQQKRRQMESCTKQASMTLESKNDIDFCTHTSPAMSPPLASRSAPCQTNHRAA